MSYRSAMENQNRVIRSSVTTPATENGATQIAVTVGPWPVNAILSRLLISANNNVSSITATIVSNGAAYLTATGATKASYIQGTQNGSLTNNSLILSFDNIYVEDALDEGFIYIILSAPSITTGTVFTVTAEGTKTLNYSKNKGEHTFEPWDRTFKVLQYVNGVTTDITTPMVNGAKVYNYENPKSATIGVSSLKSSSDYIYIGSAKQFNGVLLNIANGSFQSGSQLTAQYWNGSTWSSLSVEDNTADGQATPNSFAYSGTIRIPSIPSDWATSQISSDPLYIQEQNIISFNDTPKNFLYNPNRYWIRLKLSAISPALYLLGIVPTF